MTRIAAGFALIFLLSCSGDKYPKGVMKPAKMEKVYWDYLRADVLATERSRRDSTISGQDEAIRLHNRLFKIHGISRDEMEKSLDYYAAHPEKMRVILDSIVSKQQRIKIKPTITETQVL